MLACKVGQTVIFSAAFLDQQGHPMLVTPSVDAPLVWTNLEKDRFVAPVGHLACQAEAVGPGNDTITVQAMVGGQNYIGTLQATVSQ